MFGLLQGGNRPDTAIGYVRQEWFGVASSICLSRMTVLTTHIIAPGTPIFGLVYSDGSTGGWTASWPDTAMQIGPVRSLGLQVIGILVAKMRAEELEEVKR